MDGVHETTLADDDSRVTGKFCCARPERGDLVVWRVFFKIGSDIYGRLLAHFLEDLQLWHQCEAFK